MFSLVVAATDAGSAVGASAEHLTLKLLYQLIVILGVTRIVVWLSKKYLRQTDVAGEILAGIVLGPSLIGHFFPRAHAWVFDPSTAPIFVGVAQIGLILLMFQIGLEFEFKRNLGADRARVFAISASGIAAPFVMGYLLGPWFWSSFDAPRPDLLGFRLFFAIAMSITAIPILGRILVELGLAHTRFASLTIAAAAIDDVAGWTLLSVVSAIVAAKFTIGPVVLRLFGLAVFVAFVMYVVRPAAKQFLDARLVGGRLNGSVVNAVLFMLLVAAMITSNLGVFAIIGGFTIGVALHDQRTFVAAWKLRVEPLVFCLFLPIFFAYTGLRTNIGMLSSGDAALRCLAIIVIAFVGKFGAAYVAARLFGTGRREAVTIGVCMNTRALMELIVINIGRDLGVLPSEMFTSLVIMAIVSTFVATPLIAYLQAPNRRPLAEPISTLPPAATTMHATEAAVVLSPEV